MIPTKYPTVPETPAVYSLVNKKTGQEYIGATTNLRARFRRHLTELKKSTHKNPHLQADYDKYGPDVYELYIIVDVCDLDIEKAEIKLSKNCFNCVSRPGEAHCRYTHEDQFVMIQLRKAGLKLQTICDIFGANMPYVSRLVNGIQYRSVHHIYNEDGTIRKPRKRECVYSTRKNVKLSTKCAVQ